MAHTDNNVHASEVHKTLSEASQRVVPLFTDEGEYIRLYSEKHVFRDVTASGGNIELLMK